jgi:hypothetical protein
MLALNFLVHNRIWEFLIKSCCIFFLLFFKNMSRVSKKKYGLLILLIPGTGFVSRPPIGTLFPSNENYLILTDFILPVRTLFN